MVLPYSRFRLTSHGSEEAIYSPRRIPRGLFQMSQEGLDCCISWRKRTDRLGISQETSQIHSTTVRIPTMPQAGAPQPMKIASEQAPNPPSHHDFLSAIDGKGHELLHCGWLADPLPRYPIASGCRRDRYGVPVWSLQVVVCLRQTPAC